jgi:putative flippase GtrA
MISGDRAEGETRGVARASVRHFAIYLLAGGFAALVNLTSRYLLTPSLGFEAAVLVAYLISMATAYALFRWLVFGRSGASIVSEGYRFALVSMVSLGIVWVVSVGLARAIFPALGFTWHAEDVAHVIGVCVPAVTSYFGHIMFTFDRRS